MRGQAIAIASVIGAGVAMFVMYLSNFDSLERTQQAYYERQRFGDVFASLKRAPERIASRLADLPGVTDTETRVVADVTLDVAGLPEPATGRLISIPADSRPKLNDVFLRAGRWIEATRPDEVLASEAFAQANGLGLGDRVAAVINGRRRRLTIVGLALSPEYVYSIRPGELVPDNRRFGILWMERRALAGAFDMEGAFNDVTLKLHSSASTADAIAGVDRTLLPYGGLGALPRALQLSHWMLDNELKQLDTFGFLVPLIFFGVAAFILNIALTRMLTLQRPQIAALKALGYSDRELLWHYLKWALLVAAAGVVLGMAAGAWLGSGMIGMYNEFFRFPVLDYRLSLGVAVEAAVISLASAALGAWVSVGRAVRVPPAEAMRPAPPARYRESLVERTILRRRLTHATRMVLRNLERQPLRAILSMTGIALAVAILVVGFYFIDAMNVLMEVQFSVVQRQDATVSFVEPVSPGALAEIRSLPGVLHAEPVRTAPARFRFGHHTRNVALTGLPAVTTLNRVVDRSGRVLALPPEGVVLSQMLAQVLEVRPGDTVTVEVLEGRRPVREVVVADTVDEYFGLAAYMDRAALQRLLREGESLSGAHVQLDEAALDASAEGIHSRGADDVSAERTVDNERRGIHSRGALDVSAERTVDNERRGIHSRGALDVSAERTVDNERRGIHSRGALDVSAERTVDNERRGIHSRGAKDSFYKRLKLTPRVAAVGLTSAALRAFKDTLASNMWIMIAFNVGFAGVIAFGVVYNAARVSLSERSWELASLRVLGFTRAEISLILLGELATLTLAALPLGALLGYGLARLIVGAFDSEVYRFPVVATPQAVAWPALIVIAAALVSGLLVRRKLDRLDLIAVLKTRE